MSCMLFTQPPCLGVLGCPIFPCSKADHQDLRVIDLPCGQRELSRTFAASPPCHHSLMLSFPNASPTANSLAVRLCLPLQVYHEAIEHCTKGLAS
ncbi:hypothetical protein HBH70_124350 [Parastagonospora nodorum]|nr:hypothetical protein HBH95_124790 [Parastagonospora nodorum]KAH5135903.1 hypothetical protein HBH70_124350 [Parastagonospora nodorum]KAH5219978.1 hypothetical protein HBI62_141160 [Parastagonospora nodorum]KAH5310796.1 hypothetical protein HBI11_095370 [Parastagonospora nodorum]KAH5352101.1 hypothetical protein HBI48_155350 [Parastagonospora nodorum]